MVPWQQKDVTSNLVDSFRSKIRLIYALQNMKD